ncbi:MAG TPA: protein-methionine-sulfoxide reductase heme-binding subunit MsrQ [Anaerolineaceae bacterium]|nr:protein-methionine-sulfoxide reductase heme-binding subunit MsrQ [Anaerolineaceae bacterium]
MVQKRFALILRIATHIGSLVPLMVLIWDYQTHNLTVNPIQAAEQRTGDIAILLLTLCLACTPLATLTGFSHLTQRRKALGLYAFFYASLHLFIFSVIDFGLDWEFLIPTVTEKPYIILGLTAFVLLIPLAVTSFRWFMKKMGKNWRRLHALIYPAAVLVLVHFALQIKGDFLRQSGDVSRPLAYVIVLTLLFVLRIPTVRRRVSRWRQFLKSTGIPVRRPASGRAYSRGTTPAESQAQDPSIQPD